MKKLTKKALLPVVAAALSAQSAFAQTTFKGFNIMVNDANASVTSAGIVVINFASILIGIIAVVMLIWNFIKRSKGDASSNDALASWGFGLLFAALGLQVIRFVFFGVS